MKKNHFFIILSALGFIFLLCWLFVITLGIKNLRGLTNKSADPIVIDVTLCDVNANDLCVINFGADNLNRMVINFQLPTVDYPVFYVKAVNRDTVSVYMCEVNKTEVVDKTEATMTEVIATEVTATETTETEATETVVVESAPANAHCAGVRTPLGEPIDIEVYTTDEDKLIARGTFLVSAIALPTPIGLSTIFPSSGEETPTPPPTFDLGVTPTQTVSTQEATPTQGVPTNTPTATPDVAYPN